MSERRRTLLFNGKFVNYPTENGVWIETIEHKYCLPDDWDSKDNTIANSVAVVTDAHRFRIALQDAPSLMAMNDTPTDPWENYLSGTTDPKVANADYNGATNTQNIRTKCQSSTTYAAGWCNAYTFPDGVTKGYLPAMGELQLAYQNKAAIDAALSACGGTVINTGYNYNLLSTFYGVSGSDRNFFILRWNGGYVGYSRLNIKTYVRAFGTLEDSN